MTTDAHVTVVLARAQRVQQVLAHRAEERVELVGSVERDRGDGVVGRAFDEHGAQCIGIIHRVKRPYLFELFAVANLVLIALLAHASLPIVGSPLRHLLVFSVGIGMQALAGIAIRCVVALVRRDHSYLRVIRTRAWIVDTLRLIVGGALVVVVYGWIKLVVPLYHARLFDAELWELDRPALLRRRADHVLLDVFDAPAFLRVVDWSYANIFFVSASIAFAWALSHPERRIRVAFANGNALLWISGGWLYMLLPSVGPARVSPRSGLRIRESLRTTQTRHLQSPLQRRRRAQVPWGYVGGVQCDPIEKKPFFHAHPGALAYSFGMLGCDLHCGYCQNWVTSQALRDPARRAAARRRRRRTLVRDACSSARASSSAPTTSR
jgi:hypothetical protein